jgi:hypothetical protein
MQGACYLFSYRSGGILKLGWNSYQGDVGYQLPFRPSDSMRLESPSFRVCGKIKLRHQVRCVVVDSLRKLLGAIFVDLVSMACQVNIQSEYLIILPGGLIARVAGGELKALGKIPLRKAGLRRDVIDRLARATASAQAAKWMCL